jgi:integrase
MKHFVEIPSSHGQAAMSAKESVRSGAGRFPSDAVTDLIHALPTHRDKAFFALLVASGARWGETRPLLMEDVDAEKGTARLTNFPHRRATD